MKTAAVPGKPATTNATPSNSTQNADTYFGEPVYTYALKSGINDGYLTPFKVRQIETNLDEYTYALEDETLEGTVNQEKTYTEKDFNRIIEIEERERYRVKLFMDAIDQNQKTIVFCANQPHALAVRNLINQTKISTHPNYCVRVTSDDGKLGEQSLKTFQDNEKTIPTILTTSQKLFTGVDARNVREPQAPYNLAIDNPTSESTRPPIIKIKLADGKDRHLQSRITTSFWSPDGKPLSALEFVERLFGEIPALFKNEVELRSLWSRPDTRKALLEGLSEKGYGKEQLTEISRLINAEKSDLYDVLTYIAYATEPISRTDWVMTFKPLIFSRYFGKQQEFLNFVLDQYVKEGVEELDQDKRLILLSRLNFATLGESWFPLNVLGTSSYDDRSFSASYSSIDGFAVC